MPYLSILTYVILMSLSAVGSGCPSTCKLGKVGEFQSGQRKGVEAVAWCCITVTWWSGSGVIQA